MKYRKILDPNANDGKYQNTSEIWEDLKAFKAALEDLQTQSQELVGIVGNAFQTAPEAARGCLFSAAATCGELLYPDGFTSVYEYTPPPGFGGFTGLPVPIVFIVYNRVSGIMYFATPPFFPTTPTS